MVDPDDEFDRERLHRAAEAGDLGDVQRLVTEGCAIGVYDDMNRTPLHCAAEAGHGPVVEWLLEHGADVDAHDEQQIGETPLCLAVRNGHAEVVELLLRRGADADIRGWMGITARMRADERRTGDGARIAALIRTRRPPTSNLAGKR